MAYCVRCGQPVKPGVNFCPHCGHPVAGNQPLTPSPVPAKPSSSTAPVAPQAARQTSVAHGVVTAAVSFSVLFVVAWLGRSRFSTTLGTTLLLVVTGCLIFSFRQLCGLGLRALENWPVLKPWWIVQSRLPRGLQWAGGILAPPLVAWLTAPYLVRWFAGFGYMIAVATLAISTVAAHLFLARPAGRGA